MNSMTGSVRIPTRVAGVVVVFAALAMACTNTPTDATPTYSVGGTVSGLAGTGLVLRDNGSDDLVVSANGSFTITTGLPGGAAYSVTVVSQPSSPSQSCVVTAGSGTVATGDIKTVMIDCTTNSYTVGGMVSGLTGEGLVLRDNGRDELAVIANGPVRFATPLAAGAAYEITIMSQPASPPQICNVTRGSGTVGDANVTSIVIACTTVPSPGLVFATVSSNSQHSCGVTTSGVAYCWGDNSFGALGDGTTANRLVPVAVAGGHAFRLITVGGDFSCGIATSGAAFCWGSGGVLGNGTSTGSLVPVPVAGAHSFTELSASPWRTCGVTTAAETYCWGDNTLGELGDGTTEYRLMPVVVTGGHAFATVSVGGYNTCAVTVGGLAYCWGSNLRGQLGDGTDWPWVQRTAPVAVLGGYTFRAVRAAWFGACGLTPTGGAYCWGSSPSALERCTEYDPNGLGLRTVACNRRPVALPGGLKFSALADGLARCGITTSGAAYCWGATPMALPGGHSFAVMSAACGVTTGGVAYCWGDNSYGQLGDGTTNSSTVPVKVAGQP